MQFNITKEIFEAAVPSFRSPSGSSVFSKVEPFLEESEGTVNFLLDDYEPASDEIRIRAQHLVCLDAALRAVPEMDLVLTSTGFGVVNNQNQAPASVARVQALTESLRRRRSDADDLLVYDLRRTPWNQTTRAAIIFDHHLWCPMLVRRYGISFCDDSADLPTGSRKPVYAEEYELMGESLSRAEGEAYCFIGPELTQKLWLMEKTDTLEPPYALVLESARRLAACYLMQRNYPRALQAAHRNLLRVLEQNKELLPEYAGSRECEAQESERYQNKKDDPTFFFG